MQPVDPVQPTPRPPGARPSGASQSAARPHPDGPPAARQGRDTRTGAIVSALVAHGLVGADRQDEAVDVVDRVLGTQEAGAAPLRRRFAELAGYLGGVLVVSAGGIFLATEWARLDEGTRVALLAGVALVCALAGLAVAGLAVGGRAGGREPGAGRTGGGSAARLRAQRGALRRGAEPALRRLTGVLLLAASGSAAGAVGVQTDILAEDYSSLPELVGFATFAALALGAYLVAPTVLGQAAVAFGLFVTVPVAIDYLTGSAEPVAHGLLVLAIGLLWLVLAERGVWREIASARVVGCVLAVVGAQIPVFDDDLRWVAYLALFVVAASAFTAYVVRRAWPYLAAGVVALTLAVPEALTDWTDDTLGPAGVLLAAGVTLLGASLLGLRLRKDTTETG